MRYRVTDEALAEAIAASVSMASVLRVLGIKDTGGSNAHYKKRALALGCDLSHFTGQAHNRGKQSATRRTPEDVLILRTEGSRQKANLLVRSLLKSGVEHCCRDCGCGPEWKGAPLTLEVDHINQNWLDDRIENLRFLCPNCHSQYSRNLRSVEGN